MKKRILSYTAAVLMGVVIGFVICYTVSTRYWQKRFQDMFVGAVKTDIAFAESVRAGRENELAARMERALPRLARRLVEDFPDHPGARYNAYKIKRYVEANDLGVEPADKELLEAIPDRVPSIGSEFYYP